jgi:predicted nucleic acid-binding protein
MPNSEIVFFDANMLLEVLLSRPKQKVVRAAIEEHAGSIHISALTAHLVVHFYVADLKETDFTWAFQNSMTNDFDDALQIATGIRINANKFFTLDKKLFNSYRKLDLIDVNYLH